MMAEFVARAGALSSGACRYDRRVNTRWLGWGVWALCAVGCGDDGRATGGASATNSAGGTTGPSTTTTGEPTGGTGGSTEAQGTGSATGTTGEPTTGSTGASEGSSGGGATTSPAGCDDCGAPNQQCVDGQCVTGCQGQDPDPCPMGQVCDVVSGECHAPADACTLAGASEPCGAQSCGPGSVCDGMGACVPVAPCAGVVCSDTACWGSGCACERPKECTDPPLEALNGPFSEKLMGMDFADDCTAYMVTLRDGTDYLRRLRPEGELTEWPGVSNLDMGEVKVLRRLTVPQLHAPKPVASGPNPLPVEGLGEVAITYTCIGGCDGDIPQGVARLVEDDPNDPLPIVIPATTTTGVGPFLVAVADAGPQGLTWGEDRVLYVGNSTANGEYNTADLDMGVASVATTFPVRVHASAPVSPAHLLVALEGGAIHRFNVLTKQSAPLVEIGAHVTSLSHDSFTGQVYVATSNLEILVMDPWDGTFEKFADMPGKGRAAVSPSGKLYFVPARYLQEGSISSWDLPGTF
jgi:hypothetical protein